MKSLLEYLEDNDDGDLHHIKIINAAYWSEVNPIIGYNLKENESYYRDLSNYIKLIKYYNNKNGTIYYIFALLQNLECIYFEIDSQGKCLTCCDSFYAEVYKKRPEIISRIFVSDNIEHLTQLYDPDVEFQKF